jgi:hypothetical protein
LAETILEMPRRHLTEGDDRMAPQGLLIERLRNHGHDALRPEAEGILADMMRPQAITSLTSGNYWRLIALRAPAQLSSGL